MFKSRDTVGARVQKREHFGIAFSEKVGAERVSFGSVLHIGESRGYFIEFFLRGEPFQVLEGYSETSKGVERRFGSSRGVVERGRHFFNGVRENVGAHAALIASVHPPLKLFSVDRGTFGKLVDSVGLRRGGVCHSKSAGAERRSRSYDGGSYFCRAARDRGKRGANLRAGFFRLFGCLVYTRVRFGVVYKDLSEKLKYIRHVLALLPFLESVSLYDRKKLLLDLRSGSPRRRCRRSSGRFALENREDKFVIR